MSERRLSNRRKLVFVSVTVLIGLSIVFAVGEVAIRMFYPQQSLYPRYEFLADYGFASFKSQKMVHQMSGQWRFEYTTNKYRGRGKLHPISNAYDPPNLLVLGDSFSFGVGVNDGEEFAAQMPQYLGGKYNVVNLAQGGWGLTQQIRRFYELGQLYAPEILLLQFSGNDPSDNFNNTVTVIEEGKFRFQETNSKLNWVKKYFSHSIIQKSHFYNLIRSVTFTLLHNRHVKREMQRAATMQSADEVPIQERFYIELLDLFVKDLKHRGVRLVMISVNDHIQRNPYIFERVQQLNAEGMLTYVETADFFVGVTDYQSPEGHGWGAKAHHILGKELAAAILNLPDVTASADQSVQDR